MDKIHLNLEILRSALSKLSLTQVHRWTYVHRWTNFLWSTSYVIRSSMWSFANDMIRGFSTVTTLPFDNRVISYDLANLMYIQRHLIS